MTNNTHGVNETIQSNLIHNNLPMLNLINQKNDGILTSKSTIPKKPL